MGKLHRTMENPSSVAQPMGRYSQLARVKPHEMLYLAGQVAVDADGNMVGVGDVVARAVAADCAPLIIPTWVNDNPNCCARTGNNTYIMLPIPSWITCKTLQVPSTRLIPRCRVFFLSNTLFHAYNKIPTERSINPCSVGSSFPNRRREKIT